MVTSSLFRDYHPAAISVLLLPLAIGGVTMALIITRAAAAFRMPVLVGILLLMVVTEKALSADGLRH